MTKAKPQYRMPKGYKGHPRMTDVVDKGTQFGRTTATYSDGAYKPEAKSSADH